jgi:uncharacterized protein (UPF0335 family)
MFKSLSKADFSRLQKMINTPSRGHPGYSQTGVFKNIFENLNLGSIKHNKKINFSEIEKDKIKNLFQEETGVGIDSVDVETRISISKVFDNEKIAKESPFDDVIYLKTLSGHLEINNEKLNIGINGCFSIKSKEIKSVQHRKILIIENYDAFYHITSDMFNEGLEADCLLVYRGHGSSLRSVKCFVETFFNESYCFPDADPSGFKIALGYKNIKAVFLPKDNMELFMNYGSIEKYHVQENDSVYLINNYENFSEKLKRVIDVMNKSNKGIQQEHMLSNNIKIYKIEL